MRSEKSELFLLAISNMGSDAFYETAKARDSRFAALVHQVAVADPEWMAGFVPWLRDGAGMRTAAVVAAAEAVKGLLDAGRPAGRFLVSGALQRADEPGELLAYWHGKYGRREPKAIKRGIGRAVLRLYTERALLKYDTPSHAYRFGDVIERVHVAGEYPEVKGTWRGDLYEHAIDRRHGRGNPVPASLAMIRANACLRSRAAEEPEALLDPELLSAAGMTWEDALSLAGNGLRKRDLWEALIPSMGLMALARNLRNFDDAGVSDEAAGAVAARLSDPEQVRASRQFPFRFLAAYQAAPSLRWSWPLEKALGHSLANVPELKGRTLVLVDRSTSMWDKKMSDRSVMSWADGAAIFGTALALRAERADLIEFSGGSAPVRFRAGESALKIIGRFRVGNGSDDLGSGTDIPLAVRRHYSGHDRVVIVTDEQTRAGYLPSNMDRYPGHMSTTLIDDLIPGNVPLYMWNFGGYKLGAAPSGISNRHAFGGLGDASFRMIGALEAGRDASWPWISEG